MNTITLPNDLMHEEFHDIYLYDHNSYGSKINYRVNFQYHAINFLIEGVKEIISPEKKEIIDNRSLILIRSGNCLMTETTAQSGNYLSFILFFNDSAIDTFKNRFDIPSTSSKAKSKQASFHTLKKDDFIRNFISSIKFSLNSPAMWQVKFEEFMIYLIEKQGTEILEFFKTKTQNIALRTIVENNLLNDISIQELAFLCNMSLSSFKRRFYETYNDTPFSWIQNKRLDIVKQLLQRENVRPSDIYFEYGFSNLSSFTQAFKKRFGITPKQFQIHQN